MEQIAVTRHLSYFKTNSDEIDKGDFDKKMENLVEELKEVFKKHGLEMVQSLTSFLPIQKLSIYHCEQCGNLMVNRDQNPIKFDDNEISHDLSWVILDGGTHEGKNLCQECLPLTHRWGKYS